MGLLGDIGKVIFGGVLGGPVGAVITFTVGDDAVKCVVDLQNRVVRAGDDVYRAISPELLLVAGHPGLALLKHEAEDELLIIGHFAGRLSLLGGLTWPAAVGDVIVFAHGVLKHGLLKARRLNGQEWDMARYIFGNSLPK
jgi:hypothetical protein